MVALLTLLCGLTAPAPASATGCWRPVEVPGVINGSITDLTVGGGKLWISVIPLGVPFPGSAGENNNIVRLDLETDLAADFTNALNPDDQEEAGAHVWIDEKRQELWVTPTRGGCGRPEGFGFDLT